MIQISNVCFMYRTCNLEKKGARLTYLEGARSFCFIMIGIFVTFIFEKTPDFLNNSGIKFPDNWSGYLWICGLLVAILMGVVLIMFLNFTNSTLRKKFSLFRKSESLERFVGVWVASVNDRESRSMSLCVIDYDESAGLYVYKGRAYGTQFLTCNNGLYQAVSDADTVKATENFSRWGEDRSIIVISDNNRKAVFHSTAEIYRSANLPEYIDNFGTIDMVSASADEFTLKAVDISASTGAISGFVATYRRIPAKTLKEVLGSRFSYNDTDILKLLANLKNKEDFVF